MKNIYYVYVYIDPRNNEEFYFGKGKGSRKNRHLFEDEESDSEKAKRIAEIKKEGLSPTIRVIAAHLTEKEALLIEKTLLWTLGKWTTNISSGDCSDNFRPHNTLHKEISGFDYQNGLYYYNVGEVGEPHRNWDDYCKYGFISAGQGIRWRDAMRGFQVGDIFAAYLKKRGYVGIGRIKEKAKMIRDVRIKGVPLLNLPLRCKNMDDNSNSEYLSEYVCLVEWLRTVPRDEAKFSKKLYTTPHVRASLDNQPKTVKYLETEFEIDLRDLAR